MAYYGHYPEPLNDPDFEINNVSEGSDLEIGIGFCVLIFTGIIVLVVSMLTGGKI